MRPRASSTTLPDAPRLKASDSLADQAAAAIRQMITDGRLAPGEPLSELALADLLGVSKTPVREAFLRLKQEGLVDTLPRRGTFVFKMEPPQVRELTQFRLVLETAALGFAAEADRAALVATLSGLMGDMQEAISDGDGPGYRRLDTAFHMAIVSASGNEFLIDAYTDIAWRIMALLSRLLKYPHLNEVSNSEHVEIVAAIGDGDLGRARQMLEQHIHDSEKRYLRALAGESEAG